MDTLVLASGNQKKLDEMRAILEPLALKVVPQSDFQVPEAEETGLTFVENAILKARNAAAHTGLPAIADDSGLEVDALNGAPGIYSARWAGPDRDFRLAMAKLEKELAGREERGAVFISALALACPDGHVETVEGRVHGTLVWPPRGAKGFGYDPMFVPGGSTKTFGEMEPSEKKTFNHRAVAFQNLVALCFEEP